MINTPFTTSIKHPNEFDMVTGKTRLVKDLESINQSLRLRILTGKGELLGDPDYGSNLTSLIYQYSGEALYHSVIDDLLECLNKDTRVSVKSGDISIREDYDTGTVVVTVRYSIRNSNYSNELSLSLRRTSDE